MSGPKRCSRVPAQVSVVLACFLDPKPGSPNDRLRGLSRAVCVDFSSELPRKHWIASSDWDMVNNMIEILGIHTKKILSKARFYAILTNEVTIVNHESWLSVQIYICIGFSRVPILLSLLQLVEENGIFCN